MKRKLFKDINYNYKLLISTTIVGWKCERNEHLEWLKNKEDIVKNFPNVEFFVTLELDNDGIEPFREVIQEIKKVNGSYWTYSINDFNKQVRSQNRWIRIETGRNLIREYAQRKTWSENGEEHDLPPNIEYEGILFIDSDMTLDSEIIKKLLEVNAHVVGAKVDGYGLIGEDITDSPLLQKGGATIAALLVNSPAYFYLPFHHNSYLKINDDFTLQDTLEEQFGPILVRKDAIAFHKGSFDHVEFRNIKDRNI
jgi:hypothetical protein